MYIASEAIPAHTEFNLTSSADYFSLGNKHRGQLPRSSRFRGGHIIKLLEKCCAICSGTRKAEGTDLLNAPLFTESPVAQLIHYHVLESHFYQYYFNKDDLGYSPICHTISL